MGLIVEFDTAGRQPCQPRLQFNLLIQRLNTDEICELKEIFEDLHNRQIWTGYAILDQLPNSLGSRVLASQSTLQMGAVLFCKGIRDQYFLLKDEKAWFHILTPTATILGSEKRITSVMQKFITSQHH